MSKNTQGETIQVTRIEGAPPNAYWVVIDKRQCIVDGGPIPESGIIPKVKVEPDQRFEVIYKNVHAQETA